MKYRVLEENHYYAFGLKIAGISSHKLADATGNEGHVQNSYQWQGDYSEFDEEIGWNDFELRNYDPQLGRWVQQDPYDQFASPYTGMANDPVNSTDPDGGNAISNAVIGGLGGFITGGIINLLNDKNPVTGALVGAAGGALLGAATGAVKDLIGSSSSIVTKPVAQAGIRVVVQSTVLVASHLATETVRTGLTNTLIRNAPTKLSGLGLQLQPIANNIQQSFIKTALPSVAGQTKVGVTSSRIDYGRYSVSSKTLRDHLSSFAEDLGRDIKVTSGDRDANRNRAAGGARNSRHLYHDAADIISNGMTNVRLAEEAHNSGLFRTVIYYPVISAKGALHPHVHVDENPTHGNLFLIYTPEIKNGTVVKHGYTPR